MMCAGDATALAGEAITGTVGPPHTPASRPAGETGRGSWTLWEQEGHRWEKAFSITGGAVKPSYLTANMGSH